MVVFGGYHTSAECKHPRQDGRNLLLSSDAADCGVDGRRWHWWASQVGRTVRRYEVKIRTRLSVAGFRVRLMASKRIDAASPASKKVSLLNAVSAV
jgi:hypothetical protein